jgi:hypothetical protein
MARTGILNSSDHSALAMPDTWIEIYGQNLSPDTRPWNASDFMNGVSPPVWIKSQ